MRWNSILRRLLAAVLILSPVVIQAQVTYSASERTLPLAVGGGLSGFDPDMIQYNSGSLYQTRGAGILLGAAGWVDYYPRWMPARLRGLGIEGQARETRWRQSADEKNFSQRTAGGGAIYSWRHFANFRPYGKAGVEYGWIGFSKQPSGYRSDTRVVDYFGGGLEYRVWRRVWVRADYEYQMWPNLFARSSINPEGVTVGAIYRFSRPRLR
jgi:opacity protein-like surface antigen